MGLDESAWKRFLGAADADSQAVSLPYRRHQIPWNDNREMGMAKSKAKKGTRVPDPFPITDDLRRWFREKFGWVPRRVAMEEHEQFLDYWRSKSGVAASKLDWPATWRNWMRTASNDWRSPLGVFLREYRKNEPQLRHREYLSNDGPFKPV